jgi:hypothetical protein
MQIRPLSPLSAAASALAFMLAVAPAAQAQDQHETETFDRTVAFHPGGTLKLDNFSGMVRITATDGDNVVIHAIRRAPRERLDHIKIDVQADASSITIQANKKDDSWHERNNNVVDTDFDIQVPRQTALDVKVFSSDIKIAGVTGNQRLHTFSGTIDVTGAAGAMDAETFSGDVDVAFASAINGEVDFDSFSGRLSSNQPIAVHTGSRRRSIRGDIGGGGDMRFHFKTFSGDVTLR